MAAETETPIPSKHCSIKQVERWDEDDEWDGIRHELYLHSDDYPPVLIATYATHAQALRRADAFRRQFGE